MGAETLGASLTGERLAPKGEERGLGTQRDRIKMEGILQALLHTSLGTGVFHAPRCEYGKRCPLFRCPLLEVPLYYFIMNRHSGICTY